MNSLEIAREIEREIARLKAAVEVLEFGTDNEPLTPLPLLESWERETQREKK